MTLKEFKKALIEFAITCIPEQYEDILVIPDTSEENYMYLTTVERSDIIDFIDMHFNRSSLSVQLSNGKDISSLKVLDAFNFLKEYNNRLASVPFKNKDIEKLLDIEKAILQNNIEKVFSDRKSIMKDFLELYIDQNKKNEKVYRLSQVARKLNVGIKTIIDFFGDRGIALESSPNTKISQSLYNELSKEFGEEYSQSTDKSGDNSSVELALEKLIQDPEIKFFAAGHIWDGNDQFKNFISNSIWENGHVKNDTKAVNRAKFKDIIILKSTFQKSGKGWFRAKAIGLVVRNYLDGHRLCVNWFTFNEPIDIPTGSQYRRTFQTIELAYLRQILYEILKTYPDLFEKLNELEKQENNGHLYFESVNDHTYAEDGKSTETNQTEKKYWWYSDNFSNDYLKVIHNSEEINVPLYPTEIYEFSSGDMVICFDIQDQNILAIAEIIDYTTDLVILKFDLIPYLSINSKSLEGIFESLQIGGELNVRFQSISRTIFDQIVKQTESNSNEEIIERQDYQAPINHDGITDTKDLLDIENDVRSFALLLAAREVKPPIAIALFGRWGSGKSFFMKHLQKRINELSKHQGFLVDPSDEPVNPKRKEKDNFCTGIAQIEFNAWSYLDANLWAGLVTSIFEKLNEYITDTTKSGVAQLRVQEKLKERLVSLQREKLTKEERLKNLIDLKHSYQIESKNLKESIKTNFTKHILNHIDANDELRAAHEAIEKDELLSSLEKKLKLDELKKEAQVFNSFIRNVKATPGIKKYVIYATVSVLLGIVLYQFMGFEYSWASFLPILTGFGIDIKALKKRYSQVKSFITKFNEVVGESVELQEEVQKHEALVTESEQQIEDAKQQIDQISSRIEDFEQYMVNEIHQETIKDFIQSRADHADYKSKLGIVSIIRKDFETLSQLFYQADKANGEIEDEELRKDREFINNQFKTGKNLDRIILYIDDLDRCSDEKVLEVIQAVHLLMAFPLFNVVVGVDKRCVRNALLLKTKLEYLKIAPIADVKKLGINMVEPGDYLEKIFQIPFELKDPGNSDVERFIDHLLQDQIETEIHEEAETEIDTAPEIETKEEVEEKSESEEVEAYDQPMFKRIKQVEEKMEVPEYIEPITTKEPEALVSSAPESLMLSEHEFKAIKEILYLVGSTPRTIKQYINIYRIIRAHKRPETNKAFDDNDHLAIMFLLAMKIGMFKKYSNELFKSLKLNSNNTLGAVINFSFRMEDTSEDLRNFKNQIEDLNGLSTIKPLLDMICEVLCEHIDFVSRFSFGEEIDKVELVKEEKA
ncbi:P-loop NTPase fold protein [Fulvivirga lutea]|uniref:KAP NTPase domain-containing protein n=1 Tax=Fulvivirga lutea TaxID=2810512 RepID=A0A975A1S5_9BACT|nr:P-loop NTPase fold protein [Fulvivirga lutea]QSE98646.1 hypothetical protein JR347_06090 [Fulvivirga lutea]